MADPIYTSASPIAVNPANGELIGGATFTVHAPDDTSFSTPLAVTDPNTGVAINPLRSNSNGTLPSFKVAGDLPRVKLKSGAFVTELVSLGGLVVEQVAAAGLDPETVSSAIAAGELATAKADAAAASAVDAEEAATVATQKASAVAQVVATNDGIMATVFRQEGSAFRAELSAAFAQARTPANVVALGDSQTAGTLTPGLSYPNLVSALVDRRLGIVNKGVGGNTTAQMLARVQPDVVALAPKMCLFMGGTNDIATAVPLATTQANITSIADAVSAAGIEFVIATIPPRSQHGALGAGKVRDLNNWIRLWGAARGYRVIDLNPALVNPRSGEWASGLSVDAVHPSAAGIMLMAQAAAQVLLGNPKTSLIASTAPTECEVDYLATSAVQSAQLVNNPLFYATISDSANYPNRPDTWQSDGTAAVVSASSAGATTIQISDPLAPGPYVFSTGQVQQETRTITSVTGSSSPYTATVSVAFSNPHPVAHYIDRASAPLTLVDDARFAGKALKLVGNNMPAAHTSSVVLPPSAWAIGDKIRLIGKVALDTPVSIPSGKGVEIAMAFAGAGSTVKAVTQMNYATPSGLALTFATDAVVPAGTTSITVSVTFDSGSGSGTALFGQIGALNLTTLGVASIALPA